MLLIHGHVPIRRSSSSSTALANTKCQCSEVSNKISRWCERRARRRVTFSELKNQAGSRKRASCHLVSRRIAPRRGPPDCLAGDSWRPARVLFVLAIGYVSRDRRSEVRKDLDTEMSIEHESQLDNQD